MIKYNPYKRNKAGKKYYLITESNNMYILGLVAIVILKFIKMKRK